MIADVPLAAFDIESTGVRVDRDRIVTAAVVTIDGAQVHADEWLVNPQVDIPDEAARIHGITTEQAQRDGQDYADGYRDIRDRLETLWAQGRMIAIMNAAFDLSLLHNEGLRLGYPPLGVGPVLDPFCVDRALDPYRRGKRTLAALCGHYQVRQDDAHQATGDALAAARLAWYFQRRPEFDDYDLDALMAAQRAWHRDRQDSYRQWLLGQDRAADAAQVCSEWPIQPARGEAA